MRFNAIIGVLLLASGCASGADGPPSSPDAPCTPGERSCTGGVASWCRPDGTLDQYACDAAQGLTCDPGGCEGACAHETLGPSYIGCDYYPTVTPNAVFSGFHFAVVIANAVEQSTAHVQVLRGGAVVAERTISGNSVEAIPLPWVSELKGGEFGPGGQLLDASGPTRLVAGGAYHVMSDVPVAAYQMNPLEYSLPQGGAGCPAATDGSGGCYSYSNDSSLLLPANAIDADYVTLSWPSSPLQRATRGIPAIDSTGFVAVTATADDTVVQIDAVGEILPGAGLDAHGRGSVTLAAGDVLAVMAAPGKAAEGFGVLPVYGPDLSGTRVTASRPVSVVAGHRCAFVPTAGTGYCDHLEEAMFPSVALGHDYVSGAPPGPDGGIWPYVLRIVATKPGTTIHFDPVVSGDVVLGPGQAPTEITGLTSDVRVTADGPILVAQYLQGATSNPTSTGATPDEGDPAQSLVVPIEQFRYQTVFLTSSTYDHNYVGVVASAGSTVTLDGEVLPADAFSPVGDGAYVVARQLLGEGESHHISAAKPIGVTVYGYGKYTSTMNPGGLDLTRLNPPILR